MRRRRCRHHGRKATHLMECCSLVLFFLPVFFSYPNPRVIYFISILVCLFYQTIRIFIIIILLVINKYLFYLISLINTLFKLYFINFILHFFFIDVEYVYNNSLIKHNIKLMLWTIFIIVAVNITNELVPSKF